MSGDQLATRQETISLCRRPQCYPTFCPSTSESKASLSGNHSATPKRQNPHNCNHITSTNLILFHPALVIQTLSRPHPNRHRHLPYFRARCLKLQRITREASKSPVAGRRGSQRNIPSSTARRAT